jgi:mRNA interferase MazF
MHTFIKNFIAWFKLKPELNFKSHHPPLFKDGQIWWCSIGENVGGEISGKGEYFRRPMLVVRKLDKYSFIGVPLTSQVKTGTWYFNVKVKTKDNYSILTQVRHVDYRRMDKILGTVNSAELVRIRESLSNLIKGI